MAVTKQQLLALTVLAAPVGVPPPLVAVGGGGGDGGGGGGWLLPLKAGCTLTAIFMPPRQWPGTVQAA